MWAFLVVAGVPALVGGLAEMGVTRPEEPAYRAESATRRQRRIGRQRGPGGTDGQAGSPGEEP